MMFIYQFFIMASFTSPENIGMTPASTLWLLPLSAAIAIVYKVTKLPKITAVNLIKDSVLLFVSIVVFMIAVAVALYVLAWFFTE